MNKVKRVKFFLLFLAMVCASLFPFHSAQASGISFGQGILPIKAVYLNSKGEIENIWTNVSPSDSLYAVKFFDAQSKSELPDKKYFLDEYLKYAEDRKECEFLSGGKASRTVEYKRAGQSFEEIQTIA